MRPGTGKTEASMRKSDELIPFPPPHLSDQVGSGERCRFNKTQNPKQETRMKSELDKTLTDMGFSLAIKSMRLESLPTETGRGKIFWHCLAVGFISGKVIVAECFGS